MAIAILFLVFAVLLVLGVPVGAQSLAKLRPASAAHCQPLGAWIASR